MSKRRTNLADKSRTVVLNNNGTLELDPDDGKIRYIDVHGNTEDVWEPGDDEYERYRQFFSP